MPSAGRPAPTRIGTIDDDGPGGNAGHAERRGTTVSTTVDELRRRELHAVQARDEQHARRLRERARDAIRGRGERKKEAGDLRRQAELDCVPLRSLPEVPRAMIAS